MGISDGDDKGFNAAKTWGLGFMQAQVAELNEGSLVKGAAATQVTLTAPHLYSASASPAKVHLIRIAKPASGGVAEQDDMYLAYHMKAEPQSKRQHCMKITIKHA